MNGSSVQNRWTIPNVMLTLMVVGRLVLCYFLAIPFLPAIVWSVTLGVLFVPLDARLSKWTGSANTSAAATVAIVAPSLNDAVGAFQELGRNGQAEFAGGLEVDHELVLREDFNRRVCGLCALEDPVDIHRYARIRGRVACTVGHQAAGVVLSTPQHRRYAMRRGQFRDGFGYSEYGRNFQHHQRLGALAGHGLERSIKIGRRAAQF